MDNILIVSMGKYPNGNAGALRQHAFAKLFKQIGYTPYIIGMGESTNFNTDVYDSINYMSLREKKSNTINRAFNILYFKKRLKIFLKENPDFSTILVVSVFPEVLWYLKKYSKKKWNKTIT